MLRLNLACWVFISCSVMSDFLWPHGQQHARLINCLPEFTQTYVHWFDDAIQPSQPLLSPSPFALNLSKHQGLFQWVSSSHQGIYTSYQHREEAGGGRRRNSTAVQTSGKPQPTPRGCLRVYMVRQSISSLGEMTRPSLPTQRQGISLDGGPLKQELTVGQWAIPVTNTP